MTSNVAAVVGGAAEVNRCACNRIELKLHSVLIIH